MSVTLSALSTAESSTGVTVSVAVAAPAANVSVSPLADSVAPLAETV